MRRGASPLLLLDKKETILGRHRIPFVRTINQEKHAKKSAQKY
jgi:hypothetical protein